MTPSYADMTTGIYKYSGSERANLLMARLQLLCEYYGCPAGVHGGKTDSCFFNEQAGAEKMASMLLPVLAGAVAIGTVGAVENAVTFSPVQLAIDNEMAAYVRRAICKPFVVDDSTLATDLIDSVGPGGNFLDEMHTAENFRDEMLLSPMFQAQTWAAAHADPRKFDTTAQAAAIAHKHWHKPEKPVLSDNQLKAIDAVVSRATRD